MGRPKVQRLRRPQAVQLAVLIALSSFVICVFSDTEQPQPVAGENSAVAADAAESSPVETISEQRALLWLKKSLDVNGTLSSWNKRRKDEACTSWEGVSCDRNDSIVGINLKGMALGGSLPDNATIWASLPKLLFLNLQNSSLQGELPSSLANAEKLQALALSNNNFTGRIPLAWGELSSLVSMDLSGNMLSERLPRALANLTQMVMMDLSWNNLLPARYDTNVWKNMTSLQYLDLHGNDKLCGPDHNVLMLDACSAKRDINPMNTAYANPGVAYEIRETIPGAPAPIPNISAADVLIEAVTSTQGLGAAAVNLTRPADKDISEAFFAGDPLTILPDGTVVPSNNQVGAIYQPSNLQGTTKQANLNPGSKLVYVPMGGGRFGQLVGGSDPQPVALPPPKQPTIGLDGTWAVRPGVGSGTTTGGDGSNTSNTNTSGGDGSEQQLTGGGDGTSGGDATTNTGVGTNTDTMRPTTVVTIPADRLAVDMGNGQIIDTTTGQPVFGAAVDRATGQVVSTYSGLPVAGLTYNFETGQLESATGMLPVPGTGAITGDDGAIRFGAGADGTGAAMVVSFDALTGTVVDPSTGLPIGSAPAPSSTTDRDVLPILPGVGLEGLGAAPAAAPAGSLTDSLPDTPFLPGPLAPAAAPDAASAPSVLPEEGGSTDGSGSTAGAPQGSQFPFINAQGPSSSLSGEQLAPAGAPGGSLLPGVMTPAQAPSTTIAQAPSITIAQGPSTTAQGPSTVANAPVGALLPFLPIPTGDGAPAPAPASSEPDSTPSESPSEDADKDADEDRNLSGVPAPAPATPVEIDGSTTDRGGSFFLTDGAPAPGPAYLDENGQLVYDDEEGFELQVLAPAPALASLADRELVYEDDEDFVLQVLAPAPTPLADRELVYEDDEDFVLQVLAPAPAPLADRELVYEDDEDFELQLLAPAPAPVADGELDNDDEEIFELEVLAPAPAPLIDGDREFVFQEREEEEDDMAPAPAPKGTTSTDDTSDDTSDRDFQFVEGPPSTSLQQVVTGVNARSFDEDRYCQKLSELVDLDVQACSTATVKDVSASEVSKIKAGEYRRRRSLLQDGGGVLVENLLSSAQSSEVTDKLRQLYADGKLTELAQSLSMDVTDGTTSIGGELMSPLNDAPPAPPPPSDRELVLPQSTNPLTDDDSGGTAAWIIALAVIGGLLLLALLALLLWCCCCRRKNRSGSLADNSRTQQFVTDARGMDSPPHPEVATRGGVFEPPPPITADYAAAIGNSPDSSRDFSPPAGAAPAAPVGQRHKRSYSRQSVVSDRSDTSVGSVLLLPGSRLPGSRNGSNVNSPANHGDMQPRHKAHKRSASFSEIMAVAGPAHDDSKSSSGGTSHRGAGASVALVRNVQMDQPATTPRGTRLTAMFKGVNPFSPANPWDEQQQPGSGRSTGSSRMAPSTATSQKAAAAKPKASGMRGIVQRMSPTRKAMEEQGPGPFDEPHGSRGTGVDYQLPLPAAATTAPVPPVAMRGSGVDLGGDYEAGGSPSADSSGGSLLGANQDILQDLPPTSTPIYDSNDMALRDGALNSSGGGNPLYNDVLRSNEGVAGEYSYAGTGAQQPAGSEFGASGILSSNHSNRSGGGIGGGGDRQGGSMSGGNPLWDSNQSGMHASGDYNSVTGQGGGKPLGMYLPTIPSGSDTDTLSHTGTGLATPTYGVATPTAGAPASPLTPAMQSDTASTPLGPGQSPNRVTLAPLGDDQANAMWGRSLVSEGDSMAAVDHHRSVSQLSGLSGSGMPSRIFDQEPSILDSHASGVEDKPGNPLFDSKSSTGQQ